MNLGSSFIVGFLYLYGLILLYITFISKKNGEKEAFQNNLFNSLSLLISISVSLYILHFVGLTKVAFIVFPFDVFMIGFILLFLPSFYFFILREKNKMRKAPKTPIDDSGSEKQEVLPFKFDIYRKLTHLVVLAIILFYFTLGFIVQNFFEFLLIGLPENLSENFYTIFKIESGDFMIFTHYLVVFLVGISLIGLLTADFVRILKPDVYPLKAVNQILREKELHMRIGPHISMTIGCFSVIILFGLIQPIGPLVICTSMTMAIFGDMASNIVGRGLGKKKIRNTHKTYEGLIAGMVTAFLSGIIILIILRFFYIISVLGFFLLPLIGAILMGILDYIDLDIDDNLSFTAVITIALFFTAVFIA